MTRHGGDPVERCNHCELREAARRPAAAAADITERAPSLSFLGVGGQTDRRMGAKCRVLQEHMNEAAGKTFISIADSWRKISEQFSRNLLRAVFRMPCLSRRKVAVLGRPHAHTTPVFQRTLIA